MSDLDDNPVVISGVGLTTSLGIDRETTWRNLLAGHSGVRCVEPTELEHRDRRGHWPVNVLAAPARLLSDAGMAESNPLTRLIEQAAYEATEEARFSEIDRPRHRLGCVIGTSKGSLAVLSRSSNDPATVWQQLLPSTPASEIAKSFDLRGAALCPVAACTTGLACLQRGYELVRDGHCDVVLAGSGDASLVPMLYAAYQKMGVLAKTSPDIEPAAVCRPFDRARSGFALGEGAAVVVMERARSAITRGLTPWAVWRTGGMAADASGLTTLDPSAASTTNLIHTVCQRANISPMEIDAINVHGTATLINDLHESLAIRNVFGSSSQVPCFGIKGGLGHLLGAAGSVEIAVSLLALRDGVLPGTVNCDNLDPACSLNLSNQPIQQSGLHRLLKLSLGFGGHLGAVLLERWKQAPPTSAV
ncbi:beta-ketoacyl-[acyl-carrier-protein] synthase family protein [Thalassoroseus pseudoceratinae]|uniref:beta-ketoacyl-[acyl-carrier-protein] synthase family protein n=1 Tax=Thalassoroseus pseudoceratinae TaxID=2713176 RepID=UPI00141ED7EC|nr:beta-ketoacyl-[acyl-carrier-protein] synthase family protein [Thalassoroseus pseudoceratinae]